MKHLAIITLALLLAGCGSNLALLTPQGQALNEVSIRSSATLIAGECLRPPITRRAYSDSVHAELKRRGLPHKITIDCDGNDQPDF